METLRILFGIATIVINIFAYKTYFLEIKKYGIKPRTLCWFGWFLLQAIVVYCQIKKNGFEWGELLIISSGIGCFVVFLSSVKNGAIKKIDYLYLFLGIGSVFSWFLWQDPVITTLCAIGSDFITGIATIDNAIYTPEKEKSSGWKIFATANFVGILAVIGLPLVFYFFPIYLFLFNSSIAILVREKRLSRLNLEKNSQM